MKTRDALQNIFMIFVRLRKLTISRYTHPAPYRRQFAGLRVSSMPYHDKD